MLKYSLGLLLSLNIVYVSSSVLEISPTNPPDKALVYYDFAVLSFVDHSPESEQAS